ncbi:unnamed protein product [Leuciscus chuanchicus]
MVAHLPTMLSAPTWAVILTTVPKFEVVYLRLMGAASQRHDVHPQLLHNDQEDARIAFGQSVSDCQVQDNAYITTDHCVAIANFTQKGVAWERLAEVRSEGQEVRDHQQLDNTQEEKRVRKEQGVVGLQLLTQGLQQDINIELRNNKGY